MFGEIAALRADIRQLQQLRCDLKDSAGLRGEMAELKKDLTATKRLVGDEGWLCLPCLVKVLSFAGSLSHELRQWL